MLCHVGVVGYFDSEHRVYYYPGDGCGWTEKRESARVFLSIKHAEQFVARNEFTLGRPLRGTGVSDPLLVIPFGSSHEEIMAIHKIAVGARGEEEIDDVYVRPFGARV